MKTRTNATKTTKNHKPTTGQSGPRIKLDVPSLNANELRVLSVLTEMHLANVPGLHLHAMGRMCWPSLSKAKSNSWARNSLRRLVRGSLVEKVGDGMYRITVKGRNAMNATNKVAA